MSNPNEQLDPTDIFSMSEDELSKFDPSAAIAQAEEATPATEDPEGAQPEEPQGAEENEDPDNQEPEETGTPNPEEEGDPETKPEEESGEHVDEPSKDAPDYKACYEQLFGKPFKANGKDLTVKTPEEAIQLMQMGANYHEKMAALKPVRRVARMLQDAGITDEDSVAFLVDLHKKSPQAIAKLVKDSGIDLYEMNLDEAETYKAKPQVITDEQMSLEDTIETLNSQPGFNEMFTTVANSWDNDSQQLIMKNPGLLGVLQTHNASGQFNQIMAEVQRTRMFNPASAGIPTIQLYRDAEVALREAGAFKPQVTAQQTSQVKAQTLATAAQLKASGDPAKDRRRAAASPKSAPATQKPKLTPEDIFSLSEEEFAKIDPRKFN